MLTCASRRTSVKAPRKVIQTVNRRASSSPPIKDQPVRYRPEALKKIVSVTQISARPEAQPTAVSSQSSPTPMNGRARLPLSAAIAPSFRARRRGADVQPCPAISASNSPRISSPRVPLRSM